MITNQEKAYFIRLVRKCLKQGNQFEGTVFMFNAISDVAKDIYTEETPEGVRHFLIKQFGENL